MGVGGIRLFAMGAQAIRSCPPLIAGSPGSAVVGICLFYGLFTNNVIRGLAHEQSEF
jgi:hypothetical protein